MIDPRGPTAWAEGEVKSAAYPSTLIFASIASTSAILFCTRRISHSSRSRRALLMEGRLSSSCR